MCTNLSASVGLITSWRHSKTDITWQGEWLWDTERVCQTYYQTDNSQLDRHHSLSLSIDPTHCCPPFAALALHLPPPPSLSWASLCWATALSRDYTALFPVSGWWRGVINPNTSLFPPSSREKACKNWLEGLSCYPGLNKMELLPDGERAVSLWTRLSKCLTETGCEHWYQSSEYCARGAFIVTYCACFNSSFKAHPSDDS